jgi:hypothetical protein
MSVSINGVLQGGNFPASVTTPVVGTYPTPQPANVGPGGGVGYDWLPITGINTAANSVFQSTYTITPFDSHIVVDCTNGNVTVTLPAPSASIGQHKLIKRIDATFAAGNTLTINVAGGANVEGVTSLTITAQNALLEFRCDGTQWEAIGGGNNGSVISGAAISSITVGASPYTYTATNNGTVAVTGGTVSSVQLKRGATTITVASATGVLVPVSTGDQVIVTYSSTPTEQFIPR